MRFVVDESTGAAVAEFLRSQGHDVSTVAEVTPQAEDTAILKQAVSEKRIVVTNDKDFGDLVFRSGELHAGIILLRLRDESATNRVAVVKNLLDKHAAEIAENFVVASDALVRIRRPSRPDQGPGT